MFVARLVALYCAVGAVSAIASSPPAAGAPSARPMWEVAVVSARPGETNRHLHDSQKNRIVIVGLSVRYQGPSGEVSRPRAALVAEDGQEVGEFRTAWCRGDDRPCLKNLEWLNATGGHSTQVLSQGEALSAGSLEYWFEVPKAARELQLRFADAPLARVVMGTKGG